MTSQTDRFLQAEQMADELVEALKQLRDETVSYKTSTEQLSEVRSRLTTFLEKTERISQDTHDLIKLLNEIGGPEILRAITSVSEELNKSTAINEQRQKSLKVLVVISLISSVGTLISVLYLLLR